MQQLLNLDKINILLHLNDNLNFCLQKIDIFFSVLKIIIKKYFQLKKKHNDMADNSIKINKQHIFIFFVNSFNHTNKRGPQKLAKTMAYTHTSMKF